MLTGARDRVELGRTVRFLKSFAVVDIDPADSRLATELITDLTPKSGLSLPDFLIAAQAINRNAVLCTFNMKHYAAVPGLNAVAPYERLE